MLKWLGILLLVAACLLLGNKQAVALRERVKIWEQASRLAGMLETRIAYSTRPIPQLLNELYSTDNLTALPFLPKLSSCAPEKMAECWQTGVEKELTVLPVSDRALLAAFGAPLGRTDIAGQIAHCRTYAARFEERRTAAAAELSEKGRLYPLLGLLGGLALALLLI